MGNENTDLKGMKVLIVDDTVANIDILRQTLAPEGYVISVALRLLPDLPRI